MADRWDTEGFMGRTRAELEKGFVRAGIYFTSQTRGYLNVDQRYKRLPSGKLRGYSPSLPGQFPKKLSGQLQRSITWNFDKDKLELSCGSNLAGYPSYLQFGTAKMQARPWLSLAFDKEQLQMTRFILG